MKTSQYARFQVYDITSWLFDLETSYPCIDECTCDAPAGTDPVDTAQTPTTLLAYDGVGYLVL